MESTLEIPEKLVPAFGGRRLCDTFRSFRRSAKTSFEIFQLSEAATYH
jgi:hypothetical protein